MLHNRRGGSANGTRKYPGNLGSDNSNSSIVNRSGSRLIICLPGERFPGVLDCLAFSVHGLAAGAS